NLPAVKESPVTAPAAARRPSVVDLFCGAGGLSSGLEEAGWQSVAAVDSDPSCLRTLESTQQARLPVVEDPERLYLERTRLLLADVAELSASDLRPGGVPRNWRPDLLAGGPPCQPFSSAGKQGGVQDPRGRLFLEFVRLANELRPHHVLFENVRGLMTARTPDGQPGGVLQLIQRSFAEIGYACRFATLNAADYGAPQRRVRLFVFATTDRPLPGFPEPTHARDPDGLPGVARKPWVTLEEFLAEQPVPDAVDVVRPSGRRIRELGALTPGTGLRTGGRVEANRPGGHWGYRQDCFLADLGLPARTIRAASTPDWIRLDDGSLRRLTWRECAGLQGFLSGWRFEGTIASRFRQIGNAVQGDVARALGETLLDAWRCGGRAKPVSPPWPDEFHRRVRYTEMEHRVNGAYRVGTSPGRQSGG
ncbi:MAG: DNA cytosine methyltransferase, partial [Egibacteraceae bacterium]